MNSVLNPEAPEFHPNLTSATKDGFSTVNKTIRSSNRMPMGPSHSLFKTFTDFNVVTCRLSENIIEQSNQIVVTELPAVKLKRDDNEYNTEKIIDVNDSLLDRVLIGIDTESGVNRPSEQFLESIRRGAGVGAWNQQQAPVIAKIQMGSATFIGAKNIPRPQLTFKDRIDNSETLWVPKISDKPNSMKPLALSILYNEEGEAVGYEHPYQVELDMYEPPPWALECPDETDGAEAPQEPFPAPLEETPLTLVETEQQLDWLVDHLMQVKELAVDLEHHSYRTYQGITCLIQITTREGGDFIIDALAVREHIHKLNVVFTDPKKIKVFHGAEMDVLWLQRDFGVYVVGLFDTHLAAKALSLSGLSLKYLLIKYCGVNADKKYQLADWRIRPLPEELVTYARTDTHYLLYIWRRMRDELQRAALMRPVLLQGRHVCAQTYSKEVVDESSHMRLYLRSKKSFNAQQLAALQLLYKWRDNNARELDESTTYLVPNHMLVALAEALPRDVQGVSACCSPMPPFVKQNLITIHRIILSCRELPTEPALMSLPTSLRHEVATGAALAARQLAMLDVRHMPDFREDPSTAPPPRPAESLVLAPAPAPRLPAFTPPPAHHADTPLLLPYLVSDLNVHAEMFIPPYDRYKRYRAMAQVEKIKEYKDKEAKIAAISKGNELIKTEVLIKLQQAKTQVEKEKESEKQTNKVADKVTDKLTDKRADAVETTAAHEHRKRKMSASVTDKPTHVQKNNKKNMKPYFYTNVNYKKFYDEKEHKQPKMKFKKHK